MAKSTKTLEERIQEKNLRAQKLMEEAKKVEAQRKLLEKLHAISPTAFFVTFYGVS